MSKSGNNGSRNANHEEIERLFHAYQQQQESEAEARAKPHVIHGLKGPASRLVQQQVRQVGELHEDSSRHLAGELSALLRVPVEARLLEVEHQTHDRLLHRMPNQTYWASVKFPPFDGAGILGMELSLVLPMLDLLLGGNGITPATTRDLTDIEESVMEVVAGVVCGRLEAAWQPLVDLKFVFDHRLTEAGFRRLVASDERILSLTFALGLPHARGTLSFTFPTAVATVLLHRITQQYLTPKRRTPAVGSPSLRERLKRSHFLAEMVLPASRVRGSELLNLKAGEILVLDHRAGEPVLISIAGQTMFSATPVSVGRTRGARVRQRLEPVGFSIPGSRPAERNGDLGLGALDSRLAKEGVRRSSSVVSSEASYGQRTSLSYPATDNGQGTSDASSANRDSADASSGSSLQEML